MSPRTGIPAVLVASLAVLLALVTAGRPGQGQEETTQPGLVWVHFDSNSFARPSGSGVDAQVNRDTGTEHNAYSMVWLGLLRAPTTGEVTLSAEADNGLTLALGDHIVISGWSERGPREGKLAVKEGDRLPLTVRYYQVGGEAHCRLYWSWEGRPRELIPAEAFAHDQSHLQKAAELLEGGPEMQLPAPDDLKLPAGAIYAPSGPTPWPLPDPQRPPRLGSGPHLFIDDYLIADQSDLTRRVNQPTRLPEPVVTGPEDKNYQPWLTVVRDPETRRFRIWYNINSTTSGSDIGYMESEDGVHWLRPHRVLERPVPISFGASVIDRGPEYDHPAERYKLCWWEDGGLEVASSADGFVWELVAPGVVLEANHDITHIAWDPIRGRYMALVSMYLEGATWSGNRRTPFMSVSDDLVHWKAPWPTITADDSVEEGLTQFYGLGDVIARSDLLVGMVKVLHDDWPADPDGPVAGVGWTTLAWSRDGEHWQRDLEEFMPRNPEPGSWDHAMTWADSQVVVGDETFIYYGGYKQGHKVERLTERQVGLARMPRDRYVSRDAGTQRGSLRTPLVMLDAERMTVNADVEGTLRVRVVDRDGEPLPGFDWADCAPIEGDSLAHPVVWKGDLATLRGKPVALEFGLRRVALYGFDLPK